MVPMTQTLEYSSAGTAIPRTRRWLLWVQLIQAVPIVGVSIFLAITNSAPLLPFIAIAVCLLIWGLQRMLLLPIREPTIQRTNRKPRSYWLSASVLGLMFGMLIFGLA